jgi:DNA-binding transcriptional LysR family regulator
MKLRQIEVFRAIMKTGSISGASGLLRVSQSAVSQILLHTEDQLKFALFNRIRGRLHATSAARILFREIEHVYDGVQRVNELAESLRKCGGSGGAIQILASPGPGHSLLPETVRRFRDVSPGVRISLDMLSYGPMMEKLKSHQADFAVAMCPEAEPHVSSSHLCESHLVCLLPVGHPLCALETISARDLRGQSLIAFAGNSAIGRLIVDQFEASGEVLEIAVDVPFGVTTPGLVKNGVGVAIVDSLTASSAVCADLTTRPFKPSKAFEVVVMQSLERPPSRDSEAFISLLRATADSVASLV